MKRKTANIDIRVEPQFVEKIDAWRARQRVPPSRTVAIPAKKAYALDPGRGLLHIFPSVEAPDAWLQAQGGDAYALPRSEALGIVHDLLNHDRYYAGIVHY
jgi:hypothetical protein